MKDLTFDEFPSSSFDDWMQLVRKELGAQEFDSIVWKNENGFEVVPYLTESVFSSELDFPKHQSLCQQVDGDDPVHVNATLLNCLRGGADAISIGLKIDSYDQLKNVLENIQIEIIATHFVHEENEAQLVHWIIQYCDEHQINPKNLRGSCAFKQIGNEKCQMPLETLKEAAKKFSLFKVLTIDAIALHQQGALPVHELAFALAQGNELLNRMTTAGIVIDNASAMVQFNFSMGASYFTEIAKLRVFRSLWSTVVQAYKPEEHCSKQTYIYATTSRFLQTTKDHHTNLLRATTQAMSALIGGADSVQVLPAFHIEQSQDETSLRLARNVHHVLMEESYFNNFKDAANGSYYIQSIEAQLQDVAWKFFQRIETNGGITKSEQLLSDSIHLALDKRRDELKTGKRVVVGVNKYQNKNEPSAVLPAKDTLTGFLEKE